MDIGCLVTGASSQIGGPLLGLLPDRFFSVTAWSRYPQAELQGVMWQQADLSEVYQIDETVTHLVHLAPLALLASVLEHAHPMRVIAISTCSVRHKASSTSQAERRLAQRLKNAEEQVITVARRKGHQLTLLRPTMLYGAGRDGTIAILQKFAQRFGFLLVPGKALGLRQPVHVADVAQAVIGCIEHDGTIGKCYELGGRGQMTLRQLAERVLVDNGKRPRVYSMPLWVLRLAVYIVRTLKIRTDWDVGLLDRARQNQTVDNRPAINDFGYDPRPFNGKSPLSKTIKVGR